MGSPVPPPPGAPPPPPGAPPPAGPPPAWQPPQQPGASAAEMVNGPALALMIVAGVSAFFGIIGLLMQLLGLGMAGMQGMNELGDGPEFMSIFFSGAFQIISALIGMAVAGFIIFAAMQMRQLKSWGMSMAASIIAIFPCTAPCCIIGMGIGIWALVILLKPEVKAAFTS